MTALLLIGGILGALALTVAVLWTLGAWSDRKPCDGEGE